MMKSPILWMKKLRHREVVTHPRPPSQEVAGLDRSPRVLIPIVASFAHSMLFLKENGACGYREK